MCRWSPCFALAAVCSVAARPPADAADSATRTIETKTVNVRTPRMPTGVAMKAGIVTDAATGRVLWAMHPRQRRLIASTTKMMTALVALSRSEPDQMMRATNYQHDAGRVGDRPEARREDDRARPDRPR